jgi:serpin B|tara:strand:+ start:13195 stop:14436 length:1242 start_codon:yes stop_codon:yes gene_type:complete
MKIMNISIPLSIILLSTPLLGQQVPFAATANNGFGLDLYREMAAREGNLCLSPFSIVTALGMTGNGAAGDTLTEMEKALHCPGKLSQLSASLSILLEDFGKRKEQAAALAGKNPARKNGEPSFDLTVTNSLFGQKGYPFRKEFLTTLEKLYRAPLQFADFRNDAAKERARINEWVSARTNEKIQELLPEGSLDSSTGLVLVNALYFKAGWRYAFPKSATKPAPFHLAPGRAIETPTMHTTKRFGYSREDGYTAVNLPYSQNFAMLALVPDEIDGLPALEKTLSAGKLTALSRLPARKVALHLPKFRIEGDTIALTNPLKRLGMNLAFTRGADFSLMTSDPRGLSIDDIYHKTFIAVDEKGTEAAAATAVAMTFRSLPRPEKPVEVRLDRPFLYAIMDTRTQTALFLGRIVDPR